MLTTSLPVPQWLEHLTIVRKVMGSIPIGIHIFFFVPHSRHALNLDYISEITFLLQHLNME